MKYDLEYYCLVSLNKPVEVSPRHALDAIHKHKTDNIKWLDDLVYRAVSELRDRVGSYADIEVVSVCSGVSRSMADIIVKLTFRTNTDRNRIKLTQPDWLNILSVSDEDLRLKFSNQTIPNPIPRYESALIRQQLNEQ